MSSNSSKNSLIKRGAEKENKYYDDFCTLDIETTSDSTIKRGWCYHWQFYTGRSYHTGRTIQSLNQFLKCLAGRLDGKRKLVIYVHFLSYEFGFLSGVYDFDDKDIFALKSHRILYCKMYKWLELRCSYMLSGYSLEKWSNDIYEVEHPKLDGEEFDYSKIRYPWDDMTIKERLYCMHDVIGLYECIHRLLNDRKWNLETVPLTKTGIVRNTFRTELKKAYGRYYMRRSFPDLDIFRMLNSAYRGGDTHSNRFRIGEIISNVYCYDRSSSYPSCATMDKLPRGGWREQAPCTIKYLMKRYIEKGFACLFSIEFWGLKIKNPFQPLVYISFSKGAHFKVALDNGRVLSSEYSNMTITDVDLRIILKQYTWKNVNITKLYVSRYLNCDPVILSIYQDLYKRKTSLKGVDEVSYRLAKEDINACYGMTVENPEKNNIVFNKGLFSHIPMTEDEVIKRLEKMVLPYSDGVWITAWARYHLFLLQEFAGEHFVYSDTDSVKTDIPLDVSWYNDIIRERAVKAGMVALDPKSIMHYAGEYEQEETYSRFVTWGAKKYAFEIDDELFITIAGVPKKGSKELKTKGGLEALVPGFVFRDIGKTAFAYNVDCPATLIREHHFLELGACDIYSYPVEYELKSSYTYEQLLAEVAGYFSGDTEKAIDFLSNELYNRITN